jgi:hypothetical protein
MTHDDIGDGDAIERAEDEATTDANTPAPWQKGGPSPNPKGRPKQPKTVKEVRELARQYTVANG